MFIKGFFLLIASELCFAASTVFAKLTTLQGAVPAVESAFFRFLIGTAFAFLYLIRNGLPLAPNRWALVILRGLCNGISVIFLLLGIQYTTVTNANMLNMTYPAFLLLTASWINHEKTKATQLLFLGLSLAGIVLVIRPDFNHLKIGDIYGLISGIVAAFGVSFLRKARQYDSTLTILFYTMLMGLLVSLAFVLPVFVIPRGLNLLYVLLSGALGVLGQFFIISGYLYVKAKTGGIISTSRILFATLFGVFIFQDILGLWTLVGGSLIILSIIGLTLAQQSQASKENKAEISEA